MQTKISTETKICGDSVMNWLNEQPNSESELSEAQKSQLNTWLEADAPLIINTKTDNRYRIINSIIDYTNSISHVNRSDAPCINVSLRNHFSNLFYHWSDISMVPYRGAVLNALVRATAVQYLVIDLGKGEFDNEKKDKAFAEFIKEKTVTITETGEVFSLRTDQKLFVLVAIDNDEENINETSEFYKTLTSLGFQFG